MILTAQICALALEMQAYVPNEDLYTFRPLSEPPLDEQNKRRTTSLIKLAANSYFSQKIKQSVPDIPYKIFINIRKSLNTNTQRTDIWGRKGIAKLVSRKEEMILSHPEGMIRDGPIPSRQKSKWFESDQYEIHNKKGGFLYARGSEEEFLAQEQERIPELATIQKGYHTLRNLKIV